MSSKEIECVGPLPQLVLVNAFGKEEVAEFGEGPFASSADFVLVKAK
jgi:hypothetical protein